jgi:hypothetical protein
LRTHYGRFIHASQADELELAKIDFAPRLPHEEVVLWKRSFNSEEKLVEQKGFEPSTPTLRSPSLTYLLREPGSKRSVYYLFQSRAIYWRRSMSTWRSRSVGARPAATASTKQGATKANLVRRVTTGFRKYGRDRS